MGDHFGEAVAVTKDGTTAIVGAYLDDEPGDSGSAYVFSEDSGEWKQDATMTAADGDSRDHFGCTVAVSSDGTTAIIGALTDDDSNGESAGSAYVFEKTLATTSTTRTSVSTDSTADSTTVVPQDRTDESGKTPGFGLTSVLAGLTGAGYLRCRFTDDDTDQ